MGVDCKKVKRIQFHKNWGSTPACWPNQIATSNQGHCASRSRAEQWMPCRNLCAWTCSLPIAGEQIQKLLLKLLALC